MLLQILHQQIIEQEKDNYDPATLSRSSYNLIYGLSLGVWLWKNKLINKPTNPVELLELTEKYQQGLYDVDLSNYSLDDLTRELVIKYGKDIAKKIKNHPFDWKEQETFFISCF